MRAASSPLRPKRRQTVRRAIVIVDECIAGADQLKTFAFVGKWSFERRFSSNSDPSQSGSIRSVVGQKVYRIAPAI
jgi:hypothetical protein